MKIDGWYPIVRHFKRNELRTLEFFMNDSYLTEEYPILANRAYKYYTSLKNSGDTTFDFESELEIQVSGRRARAHIGGTFFEDPKKNLFAPSYYMAICEENCDRWIRKYHFDYVLPHAVRRQPHPIFHLQYPGELSPHLQALDLEYDHMDAWLSEPRLFFMPMSLALLVNIIFKEFPEERTKRMIERSEWRDLIRRNENLLLVPFYRCCHHFMSTRRPEELFTNDFYYGN